MKWQPDLISARSRRGRGLIWLLLAVALLGGARLARAQTPPARLRSLTQTLRESRGRHRMLLVLATTPEQADFKQQMVLLAAEQAGLVARDFRVLALSHAQLSPADRQLLVRKPGGPLPTFTLILIGKDGGVKLRRPRPVLPAELFALVDQMPMRRQELRDQRPPRPQTSGRP